jgi:hypothetical protein
MTIEMISLETMREQILQGFFQATNHGDYSFIPKLYAPSAIIHTLDGDKHGSDVIIDIFSLSRFARYKNQTFLSFIGEQKGLLQIL